MPSVHTVTSIYNMALDMIAEHPVASTGDNSPYARWLNRNYTPYVRAALRENPWNFACDYFELNAIEGGGNWRWRYAYDLPNGWIRVLQPTYDGHRNGRALKYEVKRNRLLMNDGPSRRVEIIMDVQNPGEWDDLFAMMIAARLANAMAHRFTGKASYVDLTARAAAQAFDAAELANAFEGSADEIDQFDIIRARG